MQLLSDYEKGNIYIGIHHRYGDTLHVAGSRQLFPAVPWIDILNRLYTEYSFSTVQASTVPPFKLIFC